MSDGEILLLIICAIVFSGVALVFALHMLGIIDLADMFDGDGGYGGGGCDWGD